MPGLLTPPMPESDFAAVGDQGIDKGSGLVAGAGMDHQPRRLVEDDQAIVLEHDVERDRFAQRLGGRGLRNRDLHDLSRAQFGLGVKRGRLVDPNQPAFDQALQPRAGQALGHELGLRGEIMVEPLPGAGLVHNYLDFCRHDAQ